MIFKFIIAVLATWRVSHLLAIEDGPWESIARLRALASDSFWGRLMDCFNCLSMWVAAPLSFFVGGTALEIFVVWLALSGAAILLEEYFREPFMIEEEKTDDMLWTQKGSNDQEQKGVE